MNIGSIYDTAYLAEIVLNRAEKLKDLLINVRKQLDEEKKELHAFEQKINMITELATQDTHELNREENVLLFAEGQSLAYSGEIILLTSATIAAKEKIQACLEEMSKIISNKVVNKHVSLHIDGVVKEEVQVKEKVFAAKVETPNSMVLEEKDQPFFLKKIKSDKKNIKKNAEKLSSLAKKCERCLSFTKFALILGVDCVLCLECIKETVLMNKKFISNAFEAQENNRDTVCSCPSHGTPISPQIILELLGGEAVEEASIAALKRQLSHNSVYAKFYPIICAECKKIVKKGTDPKEAISICYRHRLCIKCFK